MPWWGRCVDRLGEVLTGDRDGTVHLRRRHSPGHLFAEGTIQLGDSARSVRPVNLARSLVMPHGMGGNWARAVAQRTSVAATRTQATTRRVSSSTPASPREITSVMLLGLGPFPPRSVEPFFGFGARGWFPGGRHLHLAARSWGRGEAIRLWGWSGRARSGASPAGDQGPGKYRHGAGGGAHAHLGVRETGRACSARRASSLDGHDSPRGTLHGESNPGECSKVADHSGTAARKNHRPRRGLAPLVLLPGPQGKPAGSLHVITFRPWLRSYPARRSPSHLPGTARRDRGRGQQPGREQPSMFGSAPRAEDHPGRQQLAQQR